MTSEINASEENNLSIIAEIEDKTGFFKDIIVKIRKEELNLKPGNNFTKKNIFEENYNKLTRKNIIYYGLMTGEEPIAIENSGGNVVISILDKNQIKNRLKTIKEKDRQKIQYIHISTIQILIKSTYVEGIATPLKLILSDNRMTNLEESIIAKGTGDLAAGKIKFDINLQLSISLKDKNLDNSIILNYKFIRQDLFKEGNHPFTVTYMINYALTNSHHSITFQHKDKIEIGDLFSPILKLEQPERGLKIKAKTNRQIEEQPNHFLETIEKKNEGLKVQGKNENDKRINELTTLVRDIERRL